jgi:hypothetical protein
VCFFYFSIKNVNYWILLINYPSYMAQKFVFILFFLQFLVLNNVTVIM